MDSLILPPFIAATLHNGNIKGASLEYTTASALYTHFTIQKHSKQGPVLLTDILPVSEDWPEALKTAEINWKGLAVLKEPARADTLDLLKQITDDQVITIDTMSSSFADVIVPITTSAGQAKFLGIHTQHAADSSLFKNALEVLKHPDFFFVAVSLKKPQTIQDLEQLRGSRMLYIPAKKIVSPRWLACFDMNLDFDNSE